MAGSKFKIDVDIDDFREAIGRAKKSARKELKKALEEIGAKVSAEAKRNCPREGWYLLNYKTPPERRRVSGELRRSIRYKVEAYRRVRILAGGTGKVNYAKYVHQGTWAMPPRPFLTKSVEWSTKDIQIIVKRAAYKIMSHVS